MRSPLLVALPLPLLLFWGVAAKAQDDVALEREGLFVRDQNISVRQRSRPEYAAAPLQLGAALLTPIVEAGFDYDDNIYATDKQTTGDEIFSLSPSLALQSDWSRNLVSLYARADADQYVFHPHEDTVDWSVGTLDRLDIARDIGLAGGGAYERDTEPRTSSSSPQNVIHPIRYDLAALFLEGSKSFNRIRLTARGDYRDFSFDNDVDTTGRLLYQKDRDRGIASAAFKAEYAISPDTSIFATAVANSRRFRNALTAEASRDSKGYETSIGANFDLTHLIRGEIFVGYLAQNYDVAPYGSISGPSFGGKIEYFMTTLMTVTLTGSRSVEDADISTSGGYLATTFSGQLDHELLRNVILTLNVSGESDNYSGIDRTDTRLSESFGATYLLNREIGLNLSYSHFDQNSKGETRGVDFTVNRIFAKITYQL